MSDVTRLFTELTDLSAVLNRESDSLNELITRFETALCDLKLGVSTSLTKPIRAVTWMDEKNSMEGTTETVLGFRKGEKGWGLYVWERTPGGDSIPESERRLREAPREDRIAAVEHFPALLVAVKEKAEEVVGEVRRARESVNLPDGPDVTPVKELDPLSFLDEVPDEQFRLLFEFDRLGGRATYAQAFSINARAYKDPRGAGGNYGPGKNIEDDKSTQTYVMTERGRDLFDRLKVKYLAERFGFKEK